jgi:hypothetical protein
MVSAETGVTSSPRQHDLIGLVTHLFVKSAPLSGSYATLLLAEHWKQCGSSNVSLVERPHIALGSACDGPSLVGPLVSSLLPALGERKSQAEQARRSVQVSEM